MKACILIFILIISVDCSAQSVYRFDSKGNLIDGNHIQLRNLGIVILNDSTGATYVLDSLHVLVKAYGPDGKSLWKTDPWKDAQLPEYRIKRPVIVQFRL